ncbi:hypothetical protein PHSC3_001344 [Chlamydiales bacterium STE3]|nr:hypothetical protein PHSC3_001344 [Chlamydiales bacterium STE3]
MQYQPHTFQVIPLDATTKSTMHWQEARTKALTALAAGQKILWQLEMGLFSHLNAPLSNTSQFMTLRLALEHFRDSLWEEFHKYSKGVSLYQGTPDYSLHFDWDSEQSLNYLEWLKETFIDCEQLSQATGMPCSSWEEAPNSLKGSLVEKIFCRDVCSAYLTQLIANVPDRIPLFLMLDCSADLDPLVQLLLTARDVYPRFELLYGANHLIQDPEAHLAICWPLNEKKSPAQFKNLAHALHKLQNKKIPFKVIPESHLTVEWHGLDHLVYSPELLSNSGVRKLRGFHAAGGTLVTVGDFLGFSEEISFENYLNSTIN